MRKLGAAVLVAAALVFAQTKIDLDQMKTPPATQIFVDGEIPGGVASGTNAIFTLIGTPNPPSSLHLFNNGLRLSTNVDYTISGNTITFLTVAIPSQGDLIIADYRH